MEKIHYKKLLYLKLRRNSQRHWKTFLCTGGVSNTPLTCSVQRVRAGKVERASSSPPPPSPHEVNSLCPGGGGRGWLAGHSEFSLSLSRRGGRGRTFGRGPLKQTTYGTKYRTQNTPAAKLMYIKLPVYLFFYMALGFNDFDGGQIHYSGHWKGWALKILTFLGPNRTRFARCQIRAQKSLDFQGPHLPTALEMDFPPSKSLCPVPCKAH
jgi:hypothetical protein